LLVLLRGPPSRRRFFHRSLRPAEKRSLVGPTAAGSTVGRL